MLEPDTFDRIPKDTPWSIERSFFPSLIERGETFVAYVYRGYWIDIGTPEKYMQVHRDIMDGRYQAAPFAAAPGTAWVSPQARVEDGAIVEAPCFIDEGVVVKAGARIGPYSVIGRQCHIEEHASDRRCDRLGELPDQPGSDRAALDRRPPVPHRPQRPGRGRRGPRRQVGGHRLQQTLSDELSAVSDSSCRRSASTELNAESR